MSDLEKQQPQASYGRPQHQTEPATGQQQGQQPSSHDRSTANQDGTSLEEEE